jgi:protein SCO1/2
MKKFSNIVVILIIYLSTANLAINIARENTIEIGIDEQLNDTIPRGIELINEEGEKVMLNDLIDKPTVISFVYYRCPGICSPLMDGIAEVIDRADMEIGEDYQVFTISFDPSEYTELAVRKKKNYLSSMERKEAARQGWRFFTADSANIAHITNAMGFRYKRTGKDFLHSASLIVVSPNGKITRYLNGTYFLPFEFKMAIIESSKGQSGPTINKILQYCYSYDPAGQQYVLNITKVAGSVIMLVALVLFLVLALKPIFRRKKVSG